MHRADILKYKKRLNISSLGAAICNVAVFKSMKQRQFKDEIFISYSEEGVVLEALNLEQWQKASRYVQNFLNNKKIALLTYGYQKQVYEQLIIRGLKDYTRRMKEMGEECPYINIIHYQKLRKSCQYMDKERYVEPLKDWEKKNKKNPNFAFLIVEPIHKYEDVKQRLLQYLLKVQINMSEHHFSCLYFLLLFFTSSIKQQIKESFEKTLLEITLQKIKDKPAQVKEECYKQQYYLRIVNYTSLKLNQLDYKIVNSSKNLQRLGLQFISSKEIVEQVKKVKMFLGGNMFTGRSQHVSSIYPFQVMQDELVANYGQDYCIIPFKKSEKQKYNAVINKFLNASVQKNVSELLLQIQKNIICTFDQIQFLQQINPAYEHQRGYQIHKACINDCPSIPISEVDTFLLYIEQLKTYYCTYIVRFYGLAIKYGKGTNGQMPADMSSQEKIKGYTYYLIFDYHHRSLMHMLDNDMILDNFQVGQIILQIIYLINFLHTHEEPRSLGSLKIDQIYWPLSIALPYLKNNEENLANNDNYHKESIKSKGIFKALGEGFQGDVKLVGSIMKLMLQNGQEQNSKQADLDDHFSDILDLMLKESKYQRITLNKCMTTLEELLCIN